MKQKLIALAALASLIGISCNKCDDPVVCTQEFRMISLKLKDAAQYPVQLDSFVTIRQSNNERIQPEQHMLPDYVVVLDDAYHHKLKNQEDNFLFKGYKNSQLVVNEVFRIAGDNCHIIKKSGADSLVIN